MNKKNGFTLVELLAVIVILAVILVIAVPQIINVINESKKGVLESSARLIASSAESMKISNDTLGINSEIKCEDVANISSEDYDTCEIDFINGEAYVSLVGKGKFEGMGVLLGTKDNVIATYGLEEDDTDDHNIRYVGKNPNNYVEFGNANELWRIIGIFNMKTADGKQEKLMKIVRNSSIGGYSWDSSKGDDSGTHEDKEVNDGYGVNQWGESTYTNGSAYEGADSMRELNTLYLNGESGYCCNKKDQLTCDKDSGAVVCDFTNKGINSTYRSMIENVVWNTAGVTSNSSGRTGQSAKTAYNAERITTIGSKGEGTGQICKETTYKDGVWCTDTVTRTTTWTGKIGLIYPSDYSYASTNSDCRNWINASDADKKYCKNDNWLYNGTHYWTLSPYAVSYSSFYAWYVSSAGHVSNTGARVAFEIRPSVYLKSNVYISSGEGTQASPYKLSMN